MLKRLLLAATAALCISTASAAPPPGTQSGISYMLRSENNIGAFSLQSQDPTAANTLAALPPLHIGEVATRARVANQFATSNTAFMSRSAHIARDNVTSLSVSFPNWWVNTASAANTSEETPTGAPATITASIEYPAGVFTQLRFSGSAAGVVPSGADMMSDQATVSIPNGAKFWVRELYQNSAGIPVSGGAAAGVYGGDAITFGSAATDQTMGGTVASMGAAYGFTAFPDAIVAQTTKRAACLVGTSRVQGIRDARSDATNDGGELARAIGPRMPYLDLSAASGQALKFVYSYPLRAALMQYCSVTVDEFGINDTNAGYTAAQIEAARSTIAASFTQGPTYGATIVPFTTSTDNWATTANQTVYGKESVREQLNADIRAGLTGEVGVVDVDAAIDPTATHLWPAPGYTADGIHELTPAAQLEGRSGAVTLALPTP